MAKRSGIGSDSTHWRIGLETTANMHNVFKYYTACKREQGAPDIQRRARAQVTLDGQR